MIRCDCSIYYSDKCEILELPAGIDIRRNSRTICVDKCIADVISLLLAHGVQTRGCCCGHGTENPSVIIDQNEDVQNTFDLIKNLDNRDWNVLRWELVKHEPTIVVKGADCDDKCIKLHPNYDSGISTNPPLRIPAEICKKLEDKRLSDKKQKTDTSEINDG